MFRRHETLHRIYLPIHVFGRSSDQLPALHFTVCLGRPGSLCSGDSLVDAMTFPPRASTHVPAHTAGPVSRLPGRISPVAEHEALVILWARRALCTHKPALPKCRAGKSCVINPNHSDLGFNRTCSSARSAGRHGNAGRETRRHICLIWWYRALAIRWEGRRECRSISLAGRTDPRAPIAALHCVFDFPGPAVLLARYCSDMSVGVVFIASCSIPELVVIWLLYFFFSGPVGRAAVVLHWPRIPCRVGKRRHVP